MDGIRDGFRIGYDYASNRVRRTKSRNLGSAYEHPTVVEEYLATELKANRLLGPFPSPPIPLHISSFGVIPKRHKPGKCRLILDLSSPKGCSVNDGIDEETSSVSYMSVDDVAEVVLQLGQGSLLAKSDIKHAYRQIPVHPQDRHLLGMRWKGQYYIDGTLPFGLRSAPIIFSAVADALEWIVKSRGADHIFHYIDDFIFIGPPNSGDCRRDLQIFMETCDSLGMVVAGDKTEGPSTNLIVLGIEVDTNAMELRLPADKLLRLKDLLRQWRGRQHGVRQKLESLVGMLQHAAKVVRPGRTFIRRLYTLLTQTHQLKPHFFVRLSRESQADIEWWNTFISSWNGSSILRPVGGQNPDVEVWSDASGGWGCGAYWRTRWFQLPWLTVPIASHGIAAKELLSIVLAAAIWGHEWRGRTVRFRCDNYAAVAAVNNLSAREHLLCHHLRSLFFISARFDIDIIALYTPGVSNVAADALSRDNVRLFFSQIPHAAH